MHRTRHQTRFTCRTDCLFTWPTWTYDSSLYHLRNYHHIHHPYILPRHSTGEWMKSILDEWEGRLSGCGALKTDTIYPRVARHNKNSCLTTSRRSLQRVEIVYMRYLGTTHHMKEHSLWQASWLANYSEQKWQRETLMVIKWVETMSFYMVVCIVRWSVEIKSA